MKYVVSACLLGRNCKYNGGNNQNDALIEFLKDKEVIEICPEVDGGLPVPRPKVELKDGRAVNEYGQSAHEAFSLGVKRTMEKLKGEDIKCAILQSRSPSCGVGQIYDGSFSGTKIPGNGLCAEALIRAGYKVIDVKDMKYGEEA